MFQRGRRLSACLIAVAFIACVEEHVGFAAHQEPCSEVEHCSGVGAPVLGPDGTIYVLGNGFDVCRSGGSAGSGSAYLYAVKLDGSQKWRSSIGGSVLKIARSGTVYVADEHNLYALDSHGGVKWEVPLQPSWLDLGPDGSIYAYADGLLHALNPDGTQKWQISAHDTPTVGPDGTLYLTAGSLVYALAPNGKRIWDLNLGEGRIRALHSPQLKGGNPWSIYVLGSDHLFAVAPNGSEKWKFPFNGSLDSLYFAPDGTTYFLGSNLLYALKTDGTLKWKFKGPNGIQGPRVGPDGTIYLLGAENNRPDSSFQLGVVYALRPDGTLKLRSRLEKQGAYAWHILEVGPDGTLYVANAITNHGEGDLVAVGADGDGKSLSEESGQFILAFGADGTIYVAANSTWSAATCGRGTLYAFTPGGTQKWAFSPGIKFGGPTAITPRQ